jgi:hypothetical protein
MSAADEDEELRKEVVEGARLARASGREASTETASLEAYETPLPGASALGPLPRDVTGAAPSSPDRAELNARWRVSEALDEPPRGWGRLFAPLRRPLQRVVRFALGPLLERQERFNSAQVQFDNSFVTYVDARLDRLSAHYDRVLGLHGRRMEEIDERHLILQQELIRHVHDLVERIEFVFESAEQNHLYLEGLLRETREELAGLVARWDRALEKDR